MCRMDPSPKANQPSVANSTVFPLPGLLLIISLSIPSPHSSFCRLSRSSLKRPLKKIWTSSFSPCWSTAAQRRWTRGSVSVPASFFSHISHFHYHSLPCSHFNAVWRCMILGTHNIYYARMLLNISVLILLMINVNVLVFYAHTAT